MLSGHTAHKMQLRIMLTGGNAPQLWEPSHRELPPNLVLFCRNIPGISPEVYRTGITLQTTPEQRSAQTIDTKSSNYLIPLRALVSAQENGFDDALFVTPECNIAESTTASFVWFDTARNICTCPTFEKCLPGTTLLALSNALKKLGTIIQQKALPLTDLGKASGAAIISSTRGLVPVRAIDGHVFQVEALATTFQNLNNLLLCEQKSCSIGSSATSP
jgi:branched-subunit amino acid aminotransferase/4-amino-4-deoxychorismate lyase